jgi:hypothetical protein
MHSGAPPAEEEEEPPSESDQQSQLKLNLIQTEPEEENPYIAVNNKR